MKILEIAGLIVFAFGMTSIFIRLLFWVFGLDDIFFTHDDENEI